MTTTEVEKEARALLEDTNKPLTDEATTSREITMMENPIILSTMDWMVAEIGALALLEDIVSLIVVNEASQSRENTRMEQNPTT